MSAAPILALTQGDPAGIGPEILLKVLGDGDLDARTWHPLLIAERAALLPLQPVLPDLPWNRLRFFDSLPPRHEFERGAHIPVVDPVAVPRVLTPGRPAAADATGALAALDLGMVAVRSGHADALVTAPLNKATIAHHCDPDFRGHTDYLAAACDLECYGRDYLMTFLAPSLRVALLTTHLPLRRALAAVRRQPIVEALDLLARHASGRIAVAGLNPHAGEGGLLGDEEEAEIRPAVEEVRARGVDVFGPESPDSLFARARRGACDWVLALYHDQGLIAVKTAAFGAATNWTLGLPFVRTSVDHGTAYEIAGQGVADASSLRAVITTTVEILHGVHRPAASRPVDA